MLPAPVGRANLAHFSFSKEMESRSIEMEFCCCCYSSWLLAHVLMHVC